MKSREHTLQKAIVHLHQMKYLRVLIFAIPNGGQRNVIVASKLKAEGVTAGGVADLCVLRAGKMRDGSCANGLFLEVKIEGNKQQPSQKDFQGHCIESGYRYEAAKVKLDKLAEVEADVDAWPK